MTENVLTVTFHGITTGGVVLILGIMLKQHKIWTRMKDRLNILWRKHCKDTGDYFEPLENGNNRF